MHMSGSLQFYSSFLESVLPSVLEYFFFPGIKHNIIFLLGKARERSFILHLQPTNCLPNFADYLVRRCGPILTNCICGELNHLRGDKKAGASTQIY